MVQWLAHLKRAYDATDLPVPSLASLRPAVTAATTQDAEGVGAAAPVANSSDEPPAMETPPRAGARPNETINDPESDPWASPALHKGHGHVEPDTQSRRPNGTSTHRANASDRGPAAARDDAAGAAGLGPAQAQSSYDVPRRSALNRRDSGGWNSFDGSTINVFSNQADPAIGPEGPVQGGHSSHERTGSHTRPMGASRVAGAEADEVVTVTLLPEKEGVFMFQHRNYQVSSRRRGAKVVRRYSDFVWLLNCLLKRYPFRQLPLLPPKRVAGKPCRAI